MRKVKAYGLLVPQITARLPVPLAIIPSQMSVSALAGPAKKLISRTNGNLKSLKTFLPAGEAHMTKHGYMKIHRTALYWAIF